MATIDNLEVQITADIADLNRKLNTVEKQMSDLSSNVSRASSKMSTGFIAFGSAVGNVAANVITKAFSAIASSMDDAVSRLDTLNNFPKVMSNLGISAEASQPAIEYMTEKLNGLPTAVDAAALAVQRFTSANGNIGASTEMFLALNNAILAGGASAEIQKSALEQMSQAYAKGKPDMMEWRTMMMAMPAQMKQVAQAMGYVNSSALGDALRSGEASMNDFMATIMRLNKDGVAGFKSFEEQARGATGGVQTSITNLKTAITRGLANIMDAIGQSNIAGFFNMIASAVGTAANFVAAFIRMVLTAINALRALFGQSAIAFGKTSSSADNAATSVSGIGSAAGDATKGINGTTGAAKKLAKQLAGFDEMNVLREQESGGSGGGGGGAGAGGADLSGYDFGNLDFDTSQFEKATDKVQELAENMIKGLKKIFDFDKIGKAIKRFADDVKKFLEPVGKIAKDVWDKYLKPFLSWAGNDLFPAFLNAVGGAINFLGGVINSVWGYLEPFIDFFVVPIAQFTGSVIVGVLNGIGNALRWIGENAPVCDLLAAGLIAIGVAVAGIKIEALVAGVASAIQIFQGFLAASGSLNVALMNTAASTTGVTSAVATAGTGLTAFASTAAAAAVPVLAITGIIVALRTGYEALKLQLMLNDSATKDYMTTQQLAQYIEKQRTDGIQWQKEAMEELKNATDQLNNANGNLINAETNRRSAVANLDSVAKSLNMTTEEATRYYQENMGKVKTLDSAHLKLMDAVAKVKDAEQKVTAAEKERATSQEAVTSATDRQTEAENVQIRSMMNKQAQQLAEKGNWYQLANTLRMYANQQHEFTLENGQTVKRTKEEMAWLVRGVADDMAKSYKEWDKVWSMMPNSVKNNAQTMDTTLLNLQNMLANNGKKSGQNFGNGVTSGIQSKNNAVYNAGYQQGLQGKKGFDAALRIHSPSRVMKESGGYFSEGAALGILDNADMVASAAEKVADAANTSFSDYLDPVGIDMASKFSGLNSDIETSLSDVIEANSQTHIIVKVGEDTLIDKVIDGINESSFLANRGVINI